MSIIKSNTFENLFERDLSNTVFDFDREGGFDNNGQIKALYGADALANAIYLWIKSYQGEFIRRPTLGGKIVPFLLKPMSEEVGDQIKSSIIEGLQIDFTPSVTVRSITVEPDYVNKLWKIELSAFSEDLKLVLSIQEILEAKQ